MNDRIKLAEAMGYVLVSNYTGSFADEQGTQHWTHPEGHPVFELPDPFTDANDDYAVLEWAHKQIDSDTWTPRGKWSIFVDELSPVPENYQIGDYARAALKVIDND